MKYQKYFHDLILDNESVFSFNLNQLCEVKKSFDAQ